MPLNSKLRAAKFQNPLLSGPPNGTNEWNPDRPPRSQSCGSTALVLSDDRFRKLYREYVSWEAATAVQRHRGKSPRQAAQLASLFVVYGLLGASALGLESCYRVGSLESGALLSLAYEAYEELHSPVSISFEHAWFLLLRARAA